MPLPCALPCRTLMALWLYCICLLISRPLMRLASFAERASEISSFHASSEGARRLLSQDCMPASLGANPIAASARWRVVVISAMRATRVDFRSSNPATPSTSASITSACSCLSRSSKARVASISCAICAEGSVPMTCILSLACIDQVLDGIDQAVGDALRIDLERAFGDGGLDFLHFRRVEHRSAAGDLGGERLRLRRNFHTVRRGGRGACLVDLLAGAALARRDVQARCFFTGVFDFHDFTSFSSSICHWISSLSAHILKSLSVFMQSVQI